MRAKRRVWGGQVKCYPYEQRGGGGGGGVSLEFLAILKGGGGHNKVPAL